LPFLLIRNTLLMERLLSLWECGFVAKRTHT